MKLSFSKKLFFYASFILTATGFIFQNCSSDNISLVPEEDESNKVEPEGEQPPVEELSVHVPVFSNTSETPSFLKTNPLFSNVEVFSVLSSEDTFVENFTYGSMADGAGLLTETDGTYTFINNQEADQSIARISMDKDLKPTKGEIILNAEGTGSARQCSGSLITPEIHGFGPLYLSGSESGGDAGGVFAVDPYINASEASVGDKKTALGIQSTEQAVVLPSQAYPSKTVVMIGEDESALFAPMKGNLTMYVGDRGDLDNGKLYGLKIAGIRNTIGSSESNLVSGITYNASFEELTGPKTPEDLDAEMQAKGIMGFQRVEDIDYRKNNPREIYFTATGLPVIPGGTNYGRVYKLVLDKDDPLKATFSIAVDGDARGSEVHSPDNLVVTDNYAYIQEDPNLGRHSAKNHYARVWRYNLFTGDLEWIFEADQAKASSTTDKSGNTYGDAHTMWEFTGMIDISEQTGKKGSFMLITQNHGWNNDKFTDPATKASSSNEGSQLYIVTGLER